MENRLLIAYDCHSERRRRRIRTLVQGEASNGQCSFYEQCPPASRRGILLDNIRDAKGRGDDLWAFVVDPRARRVALGSAPSEPVAPGWMLV
ncbi:hypothetical protein ACSSZE_11125 [Acidithiobacillus caldus]